MYYNLPLFIDGEFRESDDPLEIHSPFDNHLVGRTCRAGAGEIEMAISSAVKAFEETRRMPLYERAEKLEAVIADLKEHQEEFARIISEESAKPISTARGEAARAVSTFTDALEECKRLRGEQIPLDYEPASRGRWGLIRRFPLGPILGIAPFNFPLNLVCHKVAPALAAGNTIILKPASQTPFSALRLAQAIKTAGWPDGSLNVLPMASANAHLLLEDARLKMVTFTGSPLVGWEIKNKAGHKRVTLELGGNAAVIIHEDADLAYAAARCVSGGFVQSGQNCISVQRIYLFDKIYDAFMKIFIEKVQALKVGDPADEKTFVGPMIHHSEVERVMSWIREAREAGAQVITGGEAKGNFLMPTVLTNVNPEMKVSSQEVFAPLVVVYSYTDIGEALESVNQSDFGLQAGLFTNKASIIFQAYEELDVGGLIRCPTAVLNSRVWAVKACASQWKK
jgi:acyl-CoA reductase-like NAD-dependent aldehyde dehydrogenase